MAKRPSRTWPMVLSLGIPLLIVGLAAMLITFATLIDVARINGLPFPEVFPIVVDVGMVASMVTAAQFRLRGIDGRWLAYAAFTILSLVSVIANATHAQSTADLALTTPWAASLIGAVPSATLLVITHLVMKLIPDEKERAKLQAKRERAAAHTRTVLQHVPQATPTSAPQDAPTLQRAAETQATSVAPLRRVETVSADSDEVRARVLAYLASEGKRPTGPMVGEWLGKSAKTGQRFLAQMDADGAFDTSGEEQMSGEVRSA